MTHLSLTVLVGATPCRHWASSQEDHYFTTDIYPQWISSLHTSVLLPLIKKAIPSPFFSLFLLKLFIWIHQAVSPITPSATFLFIAIMSQSHVPIMSTYSIGLPLLPTALLTVLFIGLVLFNICIYLNLPSATQLLLLPHPPPK